MISLSSATRTASARCLRHGIGAAFEIEIKARPASDSGARSRSASDAARTGFTRYPSKPALRRSDNSDRSDGASRTSSWLAWRLGGSHERMRRVDPEGAVDEDVIPSPLGQERLGDFRLQSERHMRAPGGEPSLQQRADDRRGRSDQNVAERKIRARVRGLVISDRWQFDGETEARPKLRAAAQTDFAAHSLDDAGRNGEPKTRAVVPPRERAVALFEFVEDARLRLGLDAGSRVPDDEAGLVGLFALDQHRNPARIGEFHRVAGEIQQHLAEARRVARDPSRNMIVDIGGDLDALGLRAGRQAARPRR